MGCWLKTEGVCLPWTCGLESSHVLPRGLFSLAIVLFLYKLEGADKVISEQAVSMYKGLPRETGHV